MAANKDRNGTVYVGHRHPDAFAIMPDDMIDDCIQGFVTDEGVFVDRREAAVIAFNCGQVSELTEIVISEDLW